MRSQVKWGAFLIILGMILVPLAFPFLLLYAVPLILIGAAIVLFRKREESIEPRKE
jgi:Na+-transporting methylmalonyl-CoA/oxaloacetate decarboxylase gamma subunit